MQDRATSPRTKSEQYQLYILRVWQDTADGPLRYMLKAADDDHRHVFASAQSLAEFLETTTFDVKVENQ